MTRSRVAGLVICLATVTVLVVSFWSHREPSYKGKALSEWMGGAAIAPALGGRAPAGQEWEEAVPALISYLRDGGQPHRKYAIEGLGGYGEAANAAIPLLRDALKDDDHDTRTAAEEALKKIALK